MIALPHRVIVVLGGSFDPVHIGHVKLAQEALKVLAADHLYFVPARIPPHKLAHRREASAHRVAMLRLAVGKEPRMSVCLVEIERDGPSYTLDTILWAREHLGGVIHFLAGADALVELHDWYHVRDLLDACVFHIASRPGRRLQIRRILQTRLGEARCRKLMENFLALETPDVSSTHIRRLIQAGDDRAQHFLDPRVFRYIKEQGIYSGR